MTEAAEGSRQARAPPIPGGIGQVDTRRMSPNGSTTVVSNQVMITGHEQTGFTGNWSVTAYAICALQYPVISPGRRGHSADCGNRAAVREWRRASATRRLPSILFAP